MTINLLLRIDNVYPDDTVTRETAVTVFSPEPDEDLQDWADDQLLEYTGTGRTEGDAGYFVEILRSEFPEIVPVGSTFEWGV
jgi:hypothetical protein